MFKVLLARLQQKYRTIAYPKKEPVLPDRLRGLPILDSSKCIKNCQECVSVCPTNAIQCTEKGIQIDLGRCLFCTECTTVCPTGAIAFSTEYRLATRTRQDLVFDGQIYQRGKILKDNIHKLFGRSLKLRQVSAAGCNACEVDINVLGTPGFDLGRFGIQIVASPRHADGIVVTGPVSENMKLALEKTYKAVAHPKVVIAVGSCAISGGPFIDHKEVHNGITDLFPVDIFIPGCPPHPMTILDGFLRLMGRLKS
mgnify:CR=1 FL=1